MRMRLVETQRSLVESTNSGLPGKISLVLPFLLLQDQSPSMPNTQLPPNCWLQPYSTPATPPLTLKLSVTLAPPTKSCPSNGPPNDGARCRLCPQAPPPSIPT